MREVRVEVTHADISMSYPGHATHLGPVSLAAQRSGLKGASICPPRLYYLTDYNKPYHQIELPIRVLNWEKRFHQTGAGKPFGFTLKVPKEPW